MFFFKSLFEIHSVLKAGFEMCRKWKCFSSFYEVVDYNILNPSMLYNDLIFDARLLDNVGFG